MFLQFKIKELPSCFVSFILPCFAIIKELLSCSRVWLGVTVKLTETSCLTQYVVVVLQRQGKEECGEAPIGDVLEKPMKILILCLVISRVSQSLCISIYNLNVRKVVNRFRYSCSIVS